VNKKAIKMQGFRNYNIEAMQREQLHMDLMPQQYGKSPPLSPNSGKCSELCCRRRLQQSFATVK